MSTNMDLEELAELAKLVLAFRSLEERIASRVAGDDAEALRADLRTLARLMVESACPPAARSRSASAELVATWTTLARDVLARVEAERRNEVVVTCVDCGERACMSFACLRCDGKPGASC